MKYKKLLASVLALSLTLSLVPAMVFADETPDQETVSEETAVETADEPEEMQEEEEPVGSPVPVDAVTETGSAEQAPANDDEIDYAELYFGSLRDNGTYVVTQSYINILHNVDTSGRIVIPSGANVTIDLNGYEIDRCLFFETAAVGGGVFGVEAEDFVNEGEGRLLRQDIVDSVGLVEDSVFV